MIMCNQNTDKKQNYVIWIQTVYIKIEDIYADIAKDVLTKFDTSNYELERPLSKKTKK